jgi:hypothetical protein
MAKPLENRKRGDAMKLNEVVGHFLTDCEIRGLSGETVSWYRKRLGVTVRKLEEEFGVTDLEQ